MLSIYPTSKINAFHCQDARKDLFTFNCGALEISS